LALPRPSYKLIADHIDHVVRLVGVDHVGLGSDYDGIEVTPEGMEDISMMPKLLAELRFRGYSESDLEKITSGNFFRVLAASN
jgi:membrane dipeptidase